MIARDGTDDGATPGHPTRPGRSPGRAGRLPTGPARWHAHPDRRKETCRRELGGELEYHLAGRVEVRRAVERLVKLGGQSLLGGAVPGADGASQDGGEGASLQQRRPDGRGDALGLGERPGPGQGPRDPYPGLRPPPACPDTAGKGGRPHMMPRLGEGHNQIGQPGTRLAQQVVGAAGFGRGTRAAIRLIVVARRAGSSSRSASRSAKVGQSVRPRRRRRHGHAPGAAGPRRPPPAPRRRRADRPPPLRSPRPPRPRPAGPPRQAAGQRSARSVWPTAAQTVGSDTGTTALRQVSSSRCRARPCRDPRSGAVRTTRRPARARSRRERVHRRRSARASARAGSRSHASSDSRSRPRPRRASAGSHAADSGVCRRGHRRLR